MFWGRISFWGYLAVMCCVGWFAVFDGLMAEQILVFLSIFLRCSLQVVIVRMPADIWQEFYDKTLVFLESDIVSSFSQKKVVFVTTKKIGLFHMCS